MKSVVVLFLGILAASLYAQECSYAEPNRGSSSADVGFGYPAMAPTSDKTAVDLETTRPRQPTVCRFWGVFQQKVCLVLDATDAKTKGHV